MKVEIIDLKKRFEDEEVQVLKCIKRYKNEKKY